MERGAIARHAFNHAKQGVYRSYLLVTVCAASQLAMIDPPAAADPTHPTTYSCTITTTLLRRTRSELKFNQPHSWHTPE